MHISLHVRSEKGKTKLLRFHVSDLNKDLMETHRKILGLEILSGNICSIHLPPVVHLGIVQSQIFSLRASEFLREPMLVKI